MPKAVPAHEPCLRLLFEWRATQLQASQFEPNCPESRNSSIPIRSPHEPRLLASWPVRSFASQSSEGPLLTAGPRRSEVTNSVQNTSCANLPCLPKNASMSKVGGPSAPPQGESDMEKPNATVTRAERAAVANTRAELAALGAMTVGELAAKFRELFGVPTRTRNKDYLRKRIAWRIQEQHEGGLSSRALERIAQLAPRAPARWREPIQRTDAAECPAPRKASARDPRLPPPGATLTRIHDGIEHRVTVLDDGFEFRGERHRSLSQIASLITGTPWNGFRFFFGNARGGRVDGQECPE
jgi:hypothetical protein